MAELRAPPEGEGANAVLMQCPASKEARKMELKDLIEADDWRVLAQALEAWGRGEHLADLPQKQRHAVGALINALNAEGKEARWQ